MAGEQSAWYQRVTALTKQVLTSFQAVLWRLGDSWRQNPLQKMTGIVWMMTNKNIQKFLNVSNLLVTHVHMSFYFNIDFFSFFFFLLNVLVEHYFLTYLWSGKEVSMSQYVT